ncbi:hypothetical protein [uncultured Brevibacillus sp.]|uniref:barstar family protein n=1 Tax=uncultured Brevibacillus sp. TaxID=169970 RepID=UPI0025999872|nr:hypothetical protein [uncultured Brevibacillus sp.]
MIENKVEVVNIEDIKAIKKNVTSDAKIFLAEVNGSTIHSWEDFISEMQDKFKFPTPCFDSVDRYLDWMRDLGWLEYEKYILVINDSKLFLQGKPELKNEIFSDFKNIILPFWQEEVEEVIVGGKAKSFMVYLVK